MEAKSRRKWPRIRLLALGLAAAAIAAPAAQAMPDGVDGMEARSLQELRRASVVQQDRAVTATPKASTVFSPDDRPINRASYQPKASPSVVSDSGGFELGTVALSALVLLVAAGGMTALAIHQNQGGRLANA
jgi:hypothetical protein